MFRSFDYSKVSAVHRRQSRRKAWKKGAQRAGMTGVVLLAAALCLAGVGQVSEASGRAVLWEATKGLAGAGCGCLVLGRVIRGRLRATRLGAGSEPVRWPPRKRRRRRGLASARPWASPGSNAAAPGASNHGVVLVLVLVVLALVSGVALNAQVAARWAYRDEAARWNAFRIRQAATDGVRLALERLAGDDDPAVDTLDEAWAEPLTITAPDGIQVRVEIVDENRYFDVNNLALSTPPSVRSPRAVMVDLLTLCGDVRPIGRAQSLVDWLDADDAGLREDAHYAEKQPPYATPDRVALSWSELRWVEGLSPFLDRAPMEAPEGDTPALRLRDAVTLLPVDRTSLVPVNVNTAEEATLRAVLGIENGALFAAVMAARSRGPIRGVNLSRLAIDPDLVQRLAPYLSVRSTWFRVKAEAHDGTHSAQVEALVARGEQGRLEVRQWAF